MLNAEFVSLLKEEAQSIIEEMYAKSVQMPNKTHVSAVNKIIFLLLLQ